MRGGVFGFVGGGTKCFGPVYCFGEFLILMGFVEGEAVGDVLVCFVGDENEARTLLLGDPSFTVGFIQYPSSGFSADREYEGNEENELLREVRVRAAK